MGGNLPIILIELALVFGGVLAFAWWQLRSVARDRREAAQKEAARRAAQPPVPSAVTPAVTPAVSPADEQSGTGGPDKPPPLP